MDTTCNNCGHSFWVSEANVYSIQNGEFVVRAFDCPHCGKPYQVITTNEGMRGLIEKRKTLRLAIRTAHAKKFNEKTIRRYERALDKVKREQVKMLPDLRKVGDKILAEAEETEGGHVNHI